MKLSTSLAFGLLILCSFLPARAGTPTSSNTVPIVLIWDKQTPADPTIVWRVFYTTNVLAPTNTWPLLATFTNPGSYSVGQWGWTNYNHKPGVYFFTMTASNLWGTAPFCPAASTPPALPNDFNLGVVPAP